MRNIAILLLISLNALATIKYDSSIKKCPKADATNRYISVALFHDLKASAQVKNIPNLNLHNDLREAYAGMELSIYYELASEFDANKELVILIPGGPGESHKILHDFKKSFAGISDFFEKYNVIAMDHRGLGCSKGFFPGNEPTQSLAMRYAATDIEMIRQELAPNKKIHVYGHSYGAFLGQTYALLYPDSTNKMFLNGAFSSYLDYKEAKKTFENLVRTSTPAMPSKYDYLVTNYPEYRKEILDFSADWFYMYETRVQTLPDTVDKLITLLDNGQNDEAQAMFLPNTYVMPWMMRSILCLEIFSPELDDHMYPMFDTLVKSCSEFSNISEYFHYTDLLQNLEMDVFLWGGKYDHMTPVKGITKMSQHLANNYLYIDQHLGHFYDRKMTCFTNFMDAFFASESKESLDTITQSKACTQKPSK
jgi:pimeloyl-ACP methyl ester carboxylesterase